MDVSFLAMTRLDRESSGVEWRKWRLWIGNDDDDEMIR